MKCLNIRAIHFFALGALLLFYLVTYLVPLGERPLIRPDEFRYAEIPREMIASGDWTVPRLDGVVYFEKPAFGYQLTAASFYLFGENAFALRLPPALAVLLTLAGIYLFAVRTVPRDPILPGLAGAIFLTGALVFCVGTFAVLDLQLTCAVTWTIIALYLARESETRAGTVGWLVVAGLAAGVAFLIKGFLAAAVPVLAFGPFLLWRRDWKRLLLYPWIPLAVAAAVALPWSLAIARAEPGFWPYFIVEEHWKRFTSGTYDKDAAPFQYYLPILLGGVLPSGLLWIASVRGVVRGWLRNGLTQFLLCWAVLPFVFFSISSCKLATYILPCFPPLAILLALAFRRVMRDRPEVFRGAIRTLSGVWGWLWISLGAGTGIFLAVLPLIPKLRNAFHPPVLPSILLVSAAIIYGLILVHFRRVFRPLAQTAVFLFGIGPVIVFALFSIPPDAMKDKAPEYGMRNCLAALPQVGPSDAVMTTRGGIAIVPWLLKRTDVTVAGSPGELVNGLKLAPEKYAGRHIDMKELPAVIDERRRTGRVYYLLFKDMTKTPLPPELAARNPRIAASAGVSVLLFDQTEK